MRMRVLLISLLVVGGSLWGLSPAAGALAVPVWPTTSSEMIQQQQPVSTIPPLPQPPLFSTIPPLPPTATPIRPTPTTVSVPRPAPPAAPVAPTPIPARPPAAVPAPSQSTPRAGGFPTGVVLLVFAGSATALGSGLYLFTRSRSR